MTPVLSPPSAAANDWPDAQAVRLPSGLELVVTPLPHLHLASIVLFVRVGSRYEDPSQNGLSHLLEHVLFRGCERFPDTYELNAAIESIGTGIDAATSRDFTTFEATCLPDQVGAMLGIIGAMLTRPRFAGVDVERKIITEELQDEIDAKGRDVDVDNLAKMKLFPGSAMGLKVGGQIARIQRFAEDDCRRWHGKHYTAANMVLCVTGPVELAEVAAAAGVAFDELPSGPRMAVLPTVTRPDLPAFEFTQNSASQADLQLSWVLPAEDHADWPALLLVQRLLDDGTCARLRHRVVDQLGLAYHAAADLEIYDGLSILTIVTQTRHTQAVAVVDAIFEVLAELSATEVPEPELARMHSRLALELGSVRDSPSATAYWHGMERLFPAADTLAGRFRRAMAVRTEDVQRVARQHLDRRTCQLTVVGDLPPIARATLRRRVQGAGRAGASGVAADDADQI